MAEQYDQRTKRYKINPTGTDAMLFFGRHRGLTLAQIKQKEPNYLDWIRGEAFPDELKDVVVHIQRRDHAKEIADAAHAIERAAADASVGMEKVTRAFKEAGDKLVSELFKTKKKR